MLACAKPPYVRGWQKGGPARRRKNNAREWVIINLSSAERNSAATLCSDTDVGDKGDGRPSQAALGRFTAMSEVPICVDLKPTW
jgi:hypothetical protein